LRKRFKICVTIKKFDKIIICVELRIHMLCKVTHTHTHTHTLTYTHTHTHTHTHTRASTHSRKHTHTHTHTHNTRPHTHTHTHIHTPPPPPSPPPPIGWFDLTQHTNTQFNTDNIFIKFYILIYFKPFTQNSTFYMCKLF